jgi:hypothetical protein
MSDEHLIFLGLTLAVIEITFITIISFFVWKKRNKLNITYKKILP